jgi:hypothetical protein
MMITRGARRADKIKVRLKESISDEATGAHGQVRETRDIKPESMVK